MAATTPKEYGEPAQYSGKKTFVLCFDGTGNKFSGTSADSNILKIYRMLDRTGADQFHYYQPGIGTYVSTTSLDHTGVVTRVKSWYDKAKDSAIGTNFANHVMGGYKFLMRYYSPDDDIYFFGFSRGAYTARFLAEMLDHVGLLAAGNEELIRFAWKTFSKWQARKGGDSPEEKEQTKKMYEFMRGFRETFSRPVRRLRFLGLFDTVNSVPRFESAWMQRSKFPYTARSSAKVIRHAVSLNERRAKFRQDLVTGSKKAKEEEESQEASYQTDILRSKINGNVSSSRPAVPRISVEPQTPDEIATPVPTASTEDLASEGPSMNQSSTSPPDKTKPAIPAIKPSSESLQKFSDASEHANDLSVPKPTTFVEQRQRRESLFTGPVMTRSTEDLHDAAGATSQHDEASTAGASGKAPRRKYRRYSDLTRRQDVEEVWFPGCHADIGGGWEKAKNEKWPLSHAPLVWMVQEAESAGLVFDQRKMSELYCCPDKIDDYGNKDDQHTQEFHNALRQSGVGGFIHDCLEYGGGLSGPSVLSWRFMEYLPFRRLDLEADGSWKVIRWPLPGGETRDVPDDAKIHVSVIKRMEQDEKYRPGNLIIGGGGRGTKRAGKKYGTGNWKVYKYEGDPVKEQFVRMYKPKTNEEMEEE